MKNRKSMLIPLAGAILLALATLLGCRSSNEPSRTQANVPKPQSASTTQPAPPSLPAPPSQSFDVTARFVASGWMGDGEIAGANNIQLEPAWKGNPHSDPICIKVHYTPGVNHWAGIYWQNKANNWGQLPGDNLSQAGYQRVSFYARGEAGGELVEFKVGGISVSGKPYRDSFEATTDKITLKKTWQRYEISLAGKDLSSVIGGFCWVAATTNERGITFYIDDVYYES